MAAAGEVARRRVVREAYLVKREAERNSRKETEGTDGVVPWCSCS